MSDFDRYIVLDFETTGLSPGYRPVEIAWLEFASNIDGIFPIHAVHSLINPGILIEETATKVHGITDEMVADAPTLDEFIGDRFRDRRVLVVGHNVKFDLPFFAPYCGSAESLCTMMLSLALYPDADSHSLGAMTELLGVAEPPTHRAAADVRACWMLLLHYSELAGANILGLLEKSRSINADSPLPFGKRYRGTIIRDLPLSYRQWVLANFQPDHWLIPILRDLEDGRA